jgi:hypothetical protein
MAAPGEGAGILVGSPESPSPVHTCLSTRNAAQQGECKRHASGLHLGMFKAGRRSSRSQHRQAARVRVRVRGSCSSARPANYSTAHTI